MAKKIIVAAGLLVLFSYFGGLLLSVGHSRFADFIQIGCFHFFAAVFLLLFLIMPVRRLSSQSAAIKLLRWIKIAALAGLVSVLVAVFWPRSYGSVPRHKRASTRYWDLSTGSRIAYTLIPAKGEGAKKPYPIIYLEGGPGGSIGDNIINMLTPVSEDGYDIYLYDQIGSGWSDRLTNIREYTPDRHKRDLEAIVNKIGAPKVILIGQSWGAILATIFAADNPQRVACMILTGPGPIQPEHGGLASLAPPDSLHLHDPFFTNAQGIDLANNVRTRAMAFAARAFGIKLASDKEADDFAGYLYVRVNRSTVFDTSRIREWHAGNGAGFYAGIMTSNSFSSIPDPRPKLRNTSIPILVMKGQYDNQKWGFTHEYLDLFPRHTLVVFPRAGHCIFCDQPSAYLSVIRDYLKSCQ